MHTPFGEYLQRVEADLKHGKATELTYRSSLERLLEDLSSGVEAYNDPKHIDCGAPDFVVERRNIPLGYVETKDVGADLDKVEKSDQLKRYRESLHNLILTNYLEFRWYVNGQHRLSASIAAVGKDRKLQQNLEGISKAKQLFTEFYRTQVPTVSTSRELAVRMAELAKLVRDLTYNALQAEAGIAGALSQQFRAFQEYLLPDLKPIEFADIYAQTMAYGLFAARASAPVNAKFDRASAYQYLSSNRFLRKLFLDVGEELDTTLIAPFLDDIASLLDHADLAAILKDFGKRTRTQDPVVHFYETFLASYNPKLRESRGVYYTPEPVVQYIVNSVDWLLQNEFARPLGLAAKDVQLLDPATGTGTFLYFVVRRIYDTLSARHQEGTWQEYVHAELLPRLFGFELLVAPYVVAHLKLGLLLRELGYEWSKDDRFRVFLTNTLDEGITHSETLGDLGWYISQESSEAAQVKKHTPIMVVVGNPPYSNFGMLNKNEWIRDLIETYKKGLNEKKMNLDDDYIKFIRFGQWRIDKTGQGILAFITNNSYLDGLTHRQMRKSLMESFSDIYVLNLHGNSKKQERSPDGSKDANVFDIQQGVTISLFVKAPGKAGPASVHHSELWGRRELKYASLSETDVSKTTWTDLTPLSPDWFFVPKDFDARIEYEVGWSLRSIFPLFKNGLKTDRDDLFFDFERGALDRRMKVFYSDDGLTSPFRERFKIEDSSSYDLLSRRRRSEFNPRSIQPCLYRPFDTRWLYYSPGVTSRPAWEVMRHLLAGRNLGLITTRQSTEAWGAFVTDSICGHKSCAAYDINSVFPLYLYSTLGESEGTLFASQETTRTPNLSREFIEAAASKLGLAFVLDGKGDLKTTFGPEDVLGYAYAVFHSTEYRRRYAEFLKIDYPRLPLSSDSELFAKLAAMGGELIGLHLLDSRELEKYVTTFPISGGNVVEVARYENGRVWINDSQFFGGVTEEVWGHRVGGYQVCERWLKDRKGRVLSNVDIDAYQRVVLALSETIRITAEIDAAIPNWPLI